MHDGRSNIKWGTGIPRLFEACEEYGLPKPELIDFDGDIRVNMYRKVKGEFGVNGVATQTHQTTQSKELTLSDDDKNILELVHNYPYMSQRECYGAHPNCVGLRLF